MPNGICPKCLIRPNLPKRSYCRECDKIWQTNYNKTRPPQTFTREQRDRQLQLAKERFDRMTPEEKRVHWDKKAATRKKWMKADPTIQEAMNLRARNKRATWSKERKEHERQNQRNHYERGKQRALNGLCAYSVTCNEPPVGTQKFCLRHWCSGLRLADLRAKAQYTVDELVALWLKQNGKCAISGVLLIPGDTAAIDHIIPVAIGGTSVISNLRFVHKSLNRFKWTFTDAQFKSVILSLCPQAIEWAKKS